MPNDRGARDTSVQSVDRAISVLQVLARRGVAGVTEISTELRVPKSTIFRLLGTLEARKLVEQMTTRGAYRLGNGVVQLASGSTRKHDLSLISRSACHELAEVAGETVNIAIDDGGAVVSIDQVISSATVTTVNWVGQRSPFHATAAGKVFLAHMTEPEVRARLVEPLERFTASTIVDLKTLMDHLDTVRALGFAVSQEEQEPGLASVAAPIWNLDGSLIAALAISGPTFRVNDETIPELAELVQFAAARISERNGYPKPG